MFTGIRPPEILSKPLPESQESETTLNLPTDSANLFLYLCALLYNGPIPLDLLMRLKKDREFQFPVSMDFLLLLEKERERNFLFKLEDVNKQFPDWLEWENESQTCFKLKSEKRNQLREMLGSYLLSPAGSKLLAELKKRLDQIINILIQDLISDNLTAVCDASFAQAQYLTYSYAMHHAPALYGQLDGELGALKRYNKLRASKGYEPLDIYKPSNPSSPPVFGKETNTDAPPATVVPPSSSESERVENSSPSRAPDPAAAQSGFGVLLEKDYPDLAELPPIALRKKPLARRKLQQQLQQQPQQEQQQQQQQQQIKAKAHQASEPKKSDGLGFWGLFGAAAVGAAIGFVAARNPDAIKLPTLPSFSGLKL